MTVSTEDLPAPLSWWLDPATGETAVVVRADASEVVTRPPLATAGGRSGKALLEECNPLLEECNRVVPFTSHELNAFLAQFVRATRPVDRLSAGGAA